MDNRIDEGLLRLRLGQSADASLEIVGPALMKLQNAIDTRVFSQLAEGQLTADGALQAWIEKYAYHKLLRELEKQVRVGQGAAKRLGHDMKEF